ncbi:hypothetical protein FBU30_008949 [Linnemannia zychae]|nr:hypothetical protein FBU30_008949 [Linnemannia zychae]
MPELVFISPVPVPGGAIYNTFMKYGQVVSVLSTFNSHRRDYTHAVYFTTKAGVRLGNQAVVNKSLTKISGVAIRPGGTRNIYKQEPDFWTPPLQPKKPQAKTKGNQIGVPSNSPNAARPTDGRFSGSRPQSTLAHVGSTSKPYDRPQVAPSVTAKRQQHLSKVDKTTYSSAREQRAHIDLRNRNIIDPSYISHPGELVGQLRPEESNGLYGTRDDWNYTAYICYETLYNQPSISDEGNLSMSTLTWGSQLDISTFQLHYGSIFKPNGNGAEIPVASSMTVEVRQYGDKESAAEVLAIRNDGQLPTIAKVMKEGANVASRGRIMSMKLSTEQKGVPWIDAKGMEVCSVDSVGVINSYDLNKGITVTMERSCSTRVDSEFSFHSTCISLNALDSTILVGSGEAAQIALWDTRSPSLAATTSFSCRLKESMENGLESFDPIFGIEWNPLNSHEFMTVHPHTIRVWDTRKMDIDAYATFHNMGHETLRRAQWSPRRADTIASLSVDGLVKIWKLNKFDSPADPTTLVQNPELLFVHRGHELMISDFAWCPYVGDVIATVCPSTVQQAGSIQVWRPRNLHGSDDNGEP